MKNASKLSDDFWRILLEKRQSPTESQAFITAGAACLFIVFLLVTATIQYYLAVHHFNLVEMNVNPTYVATFILVNLSTAAFVFILLLFTVMVYRYSRPKFDSCFAITSHLWIISLVAFSLAHIHIAGSQNSFLIVLIPTLAYLSHWLIGIRSAMFYFIFSTIAWLAMTALEKMDVLTYAPLFMDSSEIRKLFLEDHYVFSNSTLFIFSVFALVTITMLFEKTLKEQRDKIAAATNSLKEIQVEVTQLRKLIPICSHCKKARDDEGYWQELDHYLHDLDEIKLSHGICPECLKKHHPDQYRIIFPKDKS